MTKLDLSTLLDEAVSDAFDVLSSTLDDLGAEPPSQDELRALVDEMMQTADAATLAEQTGALAQRWGQAEVDRQLQLWLKRRTG